MAPFEILYMRPYIVPLGYTQKTSIIDLFTTLDMSRNMV